MKDLIYKLKGIATKINSIQDVSRREAQVAYLLGFIDGLPEQETIHGTIIRGLPIDDCGVLDQNVHCKMPFCKSCQHKNKKPCL